MSRSAVRTTVMMLALFVLPAGAVAASFTGTWHGAFTINRQRCTIEVVLSANGSYAQEARCGALMTQQSGTYRIYPNGEIGFSVVDWSPKQRYVVGTRVGSGHFENNAKPPGGAFKYTFTSANAMVWRDVDYGGTITLLRG